MRQRVNLANNLARLLHFRKTTARSLPNEKTEEACGRPLQFWTTKLHGVG